MMPVGQDLCVQLLPEHAGGTDKPSGQPIRLDDADRLERQPEMKRQRPAYPFQHVEKGPIFRALDDVPKCGNGTSVEIDLRLIADVQAHSAENPTRSHRSIATIVSIDLLGDQVRAVGLLFRDAKLDGNDTWYLHTASATQ